VKFADCKKCVNNLSSAKVRQPFADLHKHLFVLLSIDEIGNLLFIIVIYFQFSCHLLYDCGWYVSILKSIFCYLEH